MSGLSGRRVEVDVQTDAATWVKACSALKGELGDALYGSYLAPARLRHGRGGRVVLVTPTGFAADWLRRNCWPRVRDAWTKEDPAHRALELFSRQEFERLEGPDATAAVAPVDPAAPPAPPAVPPVRLATVEGAAVPPRAASAGALAGVGQGLHSRYGFDSFVTGPSNEFAWTVARKVADGAAGPFNLVVIHSAYGLGKTHLLQAIGHAHLERRPGSKVIHLSADHFVNGFVRATMDRAIPAFKEELRSARAAADRRHPGHRRQEGQPGRAGPQLGGAPRRGPPRGAHLRPLAAGADRARRAPALAPLRRPVLPHRGG